MASEEDHAVYNDDDLDDDDDNEPLNDVVLEDDEEDDVVGDENDDDSDSDTEDADADPDADTNSTSSIIPVTSATAAVPLATAAALDSSVVTLAIPAAVHNGNSPASTMVGAGLTATTKITTPSMTPEAKRQRIDDPATERIMSQRPPTDDSRRLFQRLWTDEDEIELLQGFLDYTTQRGTTSSGHHHDTTAFYDQIKSKLQLDFNKNQLVEKLRRLKKKYRNIVNRISSGKDFVFKSAHDQTTFEISRKIWSNSAIRNRQEFDDDDQNPNPSNNNSNIAPSSINLNNNSSDHKAVTSNALVNIDINSSEKNLMGTPKSRKRSRVKMEEKSPKTATLGANEPPLSNVSSMQGLIEETVRSCLAPLLKESINNAVSGSVLGGVGGGRRGIGGLALNAIPLNFPGVNFGGGGEVVDEKWRKQQILELEVYSKRLELVQDLIKSTLEELRSAGS
ncbi:hypothetical protein Ancab_024042 [Ancistrocladus abbreviatus]